jgi:ubiquinone/menaquinone biosynthesis C-methylase UbiE
MMKKDDSRKNYWNEQYLEYWKSRVDEAGTGKSQIIPGDSNTEENSIYDGVFKTYGFNPGNLLEVGCAWGRMFPIYLSFGLEISAVDISKAMIDAASEAWQGKENIHQLLEAPAEELPFPEEQFDNLACLAVLDATYQNQAITEFLRVTKPGARIYFTGKNDHYYSDDHEAYNAEVGARQKKHPNFFTDTHLLIKLLEDQGHKLEQAFFFPRRGDFASFRYEQMPERFYEYFLVLTRGETYVPLPVISDAYSKTFKEISAEQ